MFIPEWGLVLAAIIILGLVHNSYKEGYDKARSEDWDKTFKN